MSIYPYLSILIRAVRDPLNSFHTQAFPSTSVILLRLGFRSLHHPRCPGPTLSRESIEVPHKVQHPVLSTVPLLGITSPRSSIFPLT